MVVWVDHIPERIPALPGPADSRQDGPSLVWRLGRSLGGVPALFSGFAAGGLCLRSLLAPVSKAQATDDGAHSFARSQYRVVAHSAFAIMAQPGTH